MLEYILKRFGQSFLVLFIMSILVFVGVNLVGDPVEMLINPEADQAEVERVIRELGLDKPVIKSHGSTDAIGFANSFKEFSIFLFLISPKLILELLFLTLFCFSSFLSKVYTFNVEIKSYPKKELILSNIFFFEYSNSTS